MKKVKLIFITAVSILFCIYSCSNSSSSQSESVNNQYVIVQYSKSVNGEVSKLYLDKGDGFGFSSLSKLFDSQDSIRIHTEADLLNSMRKYGFRLVNLGIPNDRKSPFQYGIFEGDSGNVKSNN